MKYDLTEVWKGDDPSKLEFLYNAIVAMKEGTAFYGELSCPKRDITDELADGCLKIIPPADIYPEFSDDFTRASPDSSAGRDYVKLPDLKCYGAEKDGLAKLFLEEATVYECLKKKPHLNVVKYRGCVVREGRITGLALVQYDCTLEQRIKDGVRILDKERRLECLEGIRAGIAHIHSLGFAQNDLNPTNIMFGDNDTPVIIDFDSCRPQGEKLNKGGTPGWDEGYLDTSAKENDFLAIELIRKYLEVWY